MRQPESLSDRIVAKIKNNPVVAVLIAAGTVVIALATFSDATRSLLGLLKGQSPETARVELSNLSVQYTPQAFVESAKQGDLRAVKLFLAAGMDPNAKDDESNTALMYAIAEGRTEIRGHRKHWKSARRRSGGCSPATAILTTYDHWRLPLTESRTVPPFSVAHTCSENQP